MAVKEVTAYQCSVCRKLYKTSSLAEDCSGRCLSKRQVRDKNRRLRKKRMDGHYIRLHARTPEEVRDMMIKHAKEDFGLELTFTRFPSEYDHSISNSHSCPLDGVQNWGRKNDLPKGYPGFEGRISGKVSGIEDIRFSDLLKPSGFFGDVQLAYQMVGIHTGGGNGGDTFNYYSHIFLDDFPELKKVWEAKCVAERLMGTK